MFDITIVENDVFLDMPSSSQNLYFHLCMNADDDGFVSPKKVMRMCSASQDDLQVLIAKRYVLVFESGVAVIKHWTINNTIKKDRYVATTYQKEFKEITFNEWKVYTERRTIKVPLTDLQQSKVLKPEKTESGTQMGPQYSIDKVSIVENSIDTTNVVLVDEQPQKKVKQPSKKINEMFDYWEATIGQKINSNIKSNRFAVSNLLKKFEEQKLKQLIDGVAKAQLDQYAPRISDFRSLQSKVDDLITWGRRVNATKQDKTGVVL